MQLTCQIIGNPNHLQWRLANKKLRCAAVAVAKKFLVGKAKKKNLFLVQKAFLINPNLKKTYFKNRIENQKKVFTFQTRYFI